MSLDHLSPFASQASAVEGFAAVVVVANVVVGVAKIVRVEGMRAAPIRFDGLGADAPRKICRIV